MIFKLLITTLILKLQFFLKFYLSNFNLIFINKVFTLSGADSLVNKSLLSIKMTKELKILTLKFLKFVNQQYY